MTYSIVALDPESGDLGVAVQSHYFAVGARVPWVESGVGAVATQAYVQPSYGSFGLALMRRGMKAHQALRALLAADDQRERRQVAMVDAWGEVATHTGLRCIREAGSRAGDGYSVQANMMWSDTVWDAMAQGYESSSHSHFAHRLLDALDAAELAGGDVRGKQSAAMVTRRTYASDNPASDSTIELRVDDHSEPLLELRRLLKMRLAIGHANKVMDLIRQGRVEDALAGTDGALSAMDKNPEFHFRIGVELAIAGHIEKAIEWIRPVLGAGEGWAEMLRRLPAAELFPDDPLLLGRLLGEE